MRSPLSLPLLLSLIITSTIVGWSNRALAVERQWRLGVDAGWSALTSSQGTFPGWGGGAHAAYGLTDSYDLLTNFNVTTHPVSSDITNITVVDMGVGVAYSLDIVEWVPYFGLLVGANRRSGGEHQSPTYSLDVQAALGFDYRFSSSWSTGVQLRYESFSDDPLAVHYMKTFVRFEYLMGW